MNTICQDRDLTSGALARARTRTQAYARAITDRAVVTARSCSHLFDAARTDMQEQVGKKGAFSWQNFSIWIQLANGCQLESQLNQQLKCVGSQLADGRWQKFPTELSACLHSLIREIPVGNISLSLRESKTPDWESGGLPPLHPWVGHPSKTVEVVR